MIIKIYDTEIFPNLFSLGAKDISSQEREVYAIHEKRNDLEKIIDFAESHQALVGYNNLKFDNLLLYHIIKNKARFRLEAPLMVVKELKHLANEIIAVQSKKMDMTDRVKQLYQMKSIKSLDLLAIFNTVQRASLKQVSINLKFHNVQTLPYHHEKVLTDEEIEVVLKYMDNDIDITEILYHDKKKAISLRKDIKKRYQVDVTNDNDTGIAKRILNKYYSEATGLKYEDFKDLRSFNKPFALKELILPIFEFKTKPFQDMMNWFNWQVYTEGTKIKLSSEEMDETEQDKQGYLLKSKGLEVSIGLGGLHSVDGAGKFETTDKRIIRDCDVASLYPTIMVNNNIRPRHVHPEFTAILAKLMVERLADKKAGLKSEADTKKLIINSIYGLLGSEWYWLRDTKALLRVTINGQLYLCSLIEEFQMAGITVISANTDGIVCDLLPDQEELYYNICNKWQEKFKFELEYKTYKKYIRKDVNNYVSEATDGEIKQKGKYFQTKLELHKGYWFPVIPQALNNYFLKGVDPEVTIKNNKDIYDFMCSVKADENKFEMQFVSLDNSSGHSVMKREVLQKSNRWVVVNRGGKLIKYETEDAKVERIRKAKEKGTKLTDKTSKNKVVHIDKDNYVQITNRVIEKETDKYDINYSFYTQQCWEVIRQIEPLYTQTLLNL